MRDTSVGNYDGWGSASDHMQLDGAA